MFSLEAPSSPRLSDTQLPVKLYMKMEKKKKKKTITNKYQLVQCFQSLNRYVSIISLFCVCVCVCVGGEGGMDGRWGRVRGVQ